MISNIHESWKPLFFNAIEKDFFRGIDTMDERSYFPVKEDIFRVFETSVHDIKVVLLGQDPYIKENQAVGLAFAVPARTMKPPSLMNMDKELGKEIDRTMKPWREQGVFLLNTALTVGKNEMQKGVSGSHIDIWEPFMHNVIKFISTVNPCIWMLWGKHAQSYQKYIDNFVYEYPLENEVNKNIVLIAAHPAAESYKSDAGFYGCDHFNKTNKALEIQGKLIINW